jgi:cell division protein ZapA
LRIKLTVANRQYPIHTKMQEEASLRAAAKRIESMVRELESAYSVQDQQDLLAMVALRLATRLEILNSEPQINENKAVVQINRLAEKISSAMM